MSQRSSSLQEPINYIDNGVAWSSFRVWIKVTGLTEQTMQTVQMVQIPSANKLAKKFLFHSAKKFHSHEAHFTYIQLTDCLPSFPP